MQTTKQLIDRAKKAQGISSDYKLAQVLGITQSAITNWNSGRSHPDDAVAAKLAEMAGQEPTAVVAELHAVRAKTPEVRQLWLRMASQLRHAVAAVMLCCGFAMLLLAPNPQGAQAATSPLDGSALGSVHYVKSRGRRALRAIARGAASFIRLSSEYLILGMLKHLGANQSARPLPMNRDDRAPDAFPCAALVAGV